MIDNRTNSIEQAVLEKIRSGAVRKRPRAYFLLRLIAAIVVASALLVTVALVVSFVVFSVHESGEQFLLGFGIQGVLVFLQLFPWLYVVGAIVLVFLLEWLLKGFKFGYRIPLLNIFLSIVAISIALGVVINATPLHGMLLQDADHDALPIIGPLYEHIFDSHEGQGVFRGIVTSAKGNSFTLDCNDEDHDGDDGIFTVDLSKNGVAPAIGSRVLVFGRPGSERVIYTDHVQPLPPDDRK